MLELQLVTVHRRFPYVPPQPRHTNDVLLSSISLVDIGLTPTHRDHNGHIPISGGTTPSFATPATALPPAMNSTLFWYSLHAGDALLVEFDSEFDADRFLVDVSRPASPTRESVQREVESSTGVTCVMTLYSTPPVSTRRSHVLVALTDTAEVCAAVERSFQHRQSYTISPFSLRGLPMAAVEQRLDAAELEAARHEQRSYVRTVKDLLRVNMLKDQDSLRVLARTLDALPTVESALRYPLESSELYLREEAQRDFLAAAEDIVRRDIAAAKQRDVLLPWCNMGCLGCCMRRTDWDTHIRVTFESIVGLLEGFEALGREEIEATHIDIIDVLRTVVFDTDAARLRLHVEQCDMFVKDHEIGRHRIEVEEYAERVETIHNQWALLRAAREFTQAKVQLREKSAEVLRVQDTIGLREGRLSRKELLLTIEQEAAARKGIRDLEAVVRQQMTNKFHEFFAIERVARYQIELSQLTAQRDSLLAYHAEKEEEERLRASELERRRATELEEELREIRRLKKIKGAPPPPICPRCGETPSSNMHHHRLEECPERPVQCSKCNIIITYREEEDHKATCPARLVQCPQCSNFYEASYGLSEQHLNICLNAKEARRMLKEELRPVWPLDIVNPVSGNDGLLIRLRSASQKSPNLAGSFSVPRRISNIGSAAADPILKLLTVDDAPTPDRATLDSIISTSSIGEKVRLLMETVSAPIERSEVIVQVGTSIPLSEYKSLALIVADDDQKIRKPPPVKKKK